MDIGNQGSVDLIFAPSGSGKSTAVKRAGKEAVETGLLDGFHNFDMTSDVVSFESFVYQSMGVPASAQDVRQVSDVIRPGKKVGIHIDQAEILASTKSDDFDDFARAFVLALSGDAANSGKMRIFLSFNDPQLIVDTLSRLNGGKKIYPLFDRLNPFPRWTVDMMATHLMEEADERKVKLTAEQQEAILDIVGRNGRPGDIDRALEDIKRNSLPIDAGIYDFRIRYDADNARAAHTIQ
eukprot:m.97917 g.97917  ORF g.97917 m.97917 type:complete len:238 (-) comp12409_c0_seq5:651-1364(-)